MLRLLVLPLALISLNDGNLRKVIACTCASRIVLLWWSELFVDNILGTGSAKLRRGVKRPLDLLLGCKCIALIELGQAVGDT